MFHTREFDDGTPRHAAAESKPGLLAASQAGRCEVTVLPRDQVVITINGRYLVSTLQDVYDLMHAIELIKADLDSLTGGVLP